MSENTISALINCDTHLSTLPEGVITGILENTYDYSQDLILLNTQGYPLVPTLITEVQVHLGRFLKAVNTTKNSYVNVTLTSTENNQ